MCGRDADEQLVIMLVISDKARVGEVRLRTRNGAIDTHVYSLSHTHTHTHAQKHTSRHTHRRHMYTHTHTRVPVHPTPN